MRIYSERYDALDMTSVAEFGLLKDKMSFWFNSDDTLFYKSGEMTIAVNGTFPPQPTPNYPGSTLLSYVNVSQFVPAKGWRIYDINTTLSKFQSARTIEDLINKTDSREIQGSYYADKLMGGDARDFIEAHEGYDYVDGRGGDDLIRGGAGGDSLNGNSGDDWVDGGDGDDLVEGGVGSDHLDGGAGNDTIVGGSGDDTLDGGIGADALTGGIGNDTFVVDNALDKIFEATNQGSDIVYSIVSYTLTAGQHVETLATAVLGGTAAINLTGNELAQKIVGNDGNNGLYGNGGADTLYGYAGNDLLNGGTGVDTLYGGSGNDVYYVDHTADKVFETANQGTDTVLASTHFMLTAGQHIEKLATTSLAGTAAIRLTGNEFAQSISGNNGTNIIRGGGGNDVLFGNNGNDTLDGGTGNDVLHGGAGNDTLTGGAGIDYFAFNTALNSTTNVDRIVDFNVPQDTIRLDNAVMAGLGTTLGT
ncbi:calcium-binding protein, partial [Rhizobiaceae sp. 2RAB30]